MTNVVVIINAFNFLDIKVEFKNSILIRYFLEAAGSGDPEQDVHPDWLLVPGGEKSSGHDLAKVLLSVHQRKQVSNQRVTRRICYRDIQHFIFSELSA